MAVSTFPGDEVVHVLYIFNILAVVIDVIPLLVVCYAPNLSTVKKYFSIRNFIIGALMNFLLVYHIQFVLGEKGHEDTLYVAMIGMLLGTMCAFLWLLHSAVVHNSLCSRIWMSLVILIFLLGSSVLLYGIEAGFHAPENRGWGQTIATLAVLAVLVLNALPVLVSLFANKDVESDINVDAYGLVMCLLNVLDSAYFLLYAYHLDTFGSLFSIVSLVTAIFGVFQFIIFLQKMLKPWEPRPFAPA